MADVVSELARLDRYDLDEPPRAPVRITVYPQEPEPAYLPDVLSAMPTGPDEPVSTERQRAQRAAQLARAGEGVNPVVDIIKSIPAAAARGAKSFLVQAGSGMDPIPFMPEVSQEQQRLGIAGTHEAARQMEQGIQENLYQPQTTPGHYGHSVFEIGTNPINWVGPGSIPFKAGWNVISGLTGEAGAQAYKGTPYEETARLMGSFSPMVAERAAALAPGALARLPGAFETAFNAAVPSNAAGVLGGRLPRARGPRPPPNPRAVIGGNEPPFEMRLTREDMPSAPGELAAQDRAPAVEPPPMTAQAPPTLGAIAEQAPPPTYQEWNAALPRPRPAARSTEIPNIRDMSVEDAIAVARTQPHLIPSGAGGEGYYVGGPRNIENKRQLNKLRKDFDEYVAADPRGWDWYNRYRDALNLSTGGDPLMNPWQAGMHGQWSAGVDPGSEAHFVIRENNAALAGMPVKAARPAQHEAFMSAIAANDPMELMLGEKTGEYARKIGRIPTQAAPADPNAPIEEMIDPSQLLATRAGATGVNDFRYARQWGYTEPSGEPQKGAVGSAAHTFLDLETALAVDRANQMKLGGRDNWTGEELQAAPWVRQKALDLMSRNKNLTYADAHARAMRTIGDFYPAMTYQATHEAQPGANVAGHMPQSVAADAAARQEYFNDPGSTWATAPMGRDAIYSGLHLYGPAGRTGVGMRVLPTRPMTGMYKPPGSGVYEVNPGEVAQPLGTFEGPPKYDKEFVGPRPYAPFKQATEADRAIMDAGEHFRALIDAQDAGSWHKAWGGGPVSQSNSLFYPRLATGPAAIGDLFALQGKGAPHGLGDVTDSGSGALLTQFWPPREGANMPTPEALKDFGKAIRKGDFEIPGYAPPSRVRVDSTLASLVEEWGKGVGSGAATTKVLGLINRTPELRAAFNNNPYLADRALAKFERDKAWAGRWGAPRQDIQNLREMVAAGPGWIDRAEAALKDGSISLPALTALLAGAAALRHQGQQQQAADHEGL